jgi:hypothetical protein
VAAADVPRPISASSLTTSKEPVERVESFIGLDITPGWLYGYAGGIIAPYGNINTPGFRVWIFGESGTYRYLSDPMSTIRGTEQVGEMLVGYGFCGERYWLNLFVGVNVDDEKIFSPDPDNPVQGTKFGAKIRAEFSIQPTSWSMVSGELDYSTAFQRYHAVGQLGFGMFRKGLFLGPEVAVMGNEQYNQRRVGGHLKAIDEKYGEINLSVGYSNTSDFKSGPYGMMEFNVRF